ncbi:thermostable hemolysin [Burkholderiaceae bacterium DAT-1]|nr:thermostable hemolysin [Burkholderiaceae bacterium DAT-1]
MQIRVVRPDTHDWSKSIALVREKYRRTFKAEVNPNPDCFVACMQQDESGERTPLAVAGITFTESRKLFSEQYLNAPVEQLISRMEGRVVPREAVVEVGSLASSRFQSGTELVRSLPIMCWCMGKRYILFTATKQLRNLLDKLEYEFNPLHVADADTLDESTLKRWGNYYEHMPVTGYLCLTRTASDFASQTGRYRFDNLVVNLNKQAEEEPYAMA